MTLAGIKLALIGILLALAAYFGVAPKYRPMAFCVAGVIFIIFVLRHLYLYHRERE